jgi:hypothetical protein
LQQTQRPRLEDAEKLSTLLPAVLLAGESARDLAETQAFEDRVEPEVA